MNIKKDKKKGNTVQEDSSETDPTIRQEFPGSDTSKKKIEEGIRNVKEETLPTPGDSVPDDNEPLKEK